MKTLNLGMILGMIWVQTTAAFANEGCEWVEAYQNDQMVQLGKNINLQRLLKTDSISDLSSILKQQLVIAAKKMAYEAEEHDAITSATTAAEMLVNGSEGGDAYILNYRLEDGMKLTVIQSYPGGNPYGMIFKHGTRHIIGQINDGDIVCSEE